MGKRIGRYTGIVVLAALGLAGCGGQDVVDSGATTVRAGDPVAQNRAPREQMPGPPPSTVRTGTDAQGSTPAPTHRHPLGPPELRLEATGQPYKEGQVGPRVEAGEEEIIAYATGLPPSIRVHWCAGVLGTECFIRAEQRSDPQGRSLFRFIVPPDVEPEREARVLIRNLATDEILAAASFSVVPSTAGCPDEGVGCPSGDDPDLCAGSADCCPPPPETSDNPSCPYPAGERW